MRTLLILRHGKSAWDQPIQDDFDRPLITKGVERTHLIAETLLQKGIVPGLIVCSPAARTMQTARIVAETLHYPVEQILSDRNLYFESTDEYFSTVFSAPDSIQTLMIVGHNPMSTAFANYFLTDKIDNLPTSGLVAIESAAKSWTDFVNDEWKQLFMLFPKKLMNHGS